MHLASDQFRPAGADAPSGFTLVEVLVATTLLGLLTAGSIWALAQANTYASISRLYTGAETVAQNQIDLILTDGPFNPQNSPPEIPPALTVGTTCVGTGCVPPSAVPGPTIYSEPAGADGNTHSVIGSMTTTVAKVPPINGTDLNLYTATVVVTFTYRSKQYRVQLNAMRASDV
jgi:prepilin-type N-terminal cleavage/methylation domain-containing protein